MINIEEEGLIRIIRMLANIKSRLRDNREEHIQQKMQRSTHREIENLGLADTRIVESRVWEHNTNYAGESMSSLGLGLGLSLCLCLCLV